MRLKNLSVTGGPLSNIVLKFSDVNVIYGLNESGKTHIVDAILQCLFNDYYKNAQKLGLYGIENALLEVSYEENGIVKNEKIVLKKKSHSIFQQYIHQVIATSLSKGFSPEKLFIVRSADASFTEHTGVDVSFLSNLLAPADKLNKISSTIQETIKKADLKNLDEIENKGRGQKYHELKKQIKNIDEILSKLTNYDTSELIQINQQIETCEQEIARLNQAKHYLAYTLKNEITNLEKQLNNFLHLDELNKRLNEYLHLEQNLDTAQNDLKLCEMEIENLKSDLEDLTNQKEKIPSITDEEVQNLQEQINEYNRLSAEINKLSTVEKKFNEVQDHLNWLNSAIKEYNTALQHKTSISPVVLFGVPIALILISSVLFFSHTLFAFLPLTVAVFWLGYILLQHEKIFQNQVHKEKITEISRTYAERFGTELKDSISLEAQLDSLKMNYGALEIQKKHLEQLKANLENKFQLISSSYLMQLYPDHDKPQSWNLILNQLKQSLRKLKDLQEKINTKNISIGQKNNEKEKIQKKIKEIESSLETLEKQIQNFFEAMGKSQVPPDEWHKTFLDLKNQKLQIETDLSKKSGILETLGISSPAQVPDPGISYDPARLDELNKQRHSLQLKRDEIIEKNRNIITEAQRIIQSNNHDPVLLYEDGLKARENTRNELNDVIAEIIAGKIIHDTIEETKSRQLDELQKVLDSTPTAQYMYDITQRYNTITIKDNDIIIGNDNFDEFSFKALSTGTQEQILLAIRLGLIEHLWTHKPSFLLLDDAFQHSDYKRRPQIIRALFHLAQKRWQIIYLTMDDHIRKLFHDISKDFSQLQFTEYDISQ